jgi:hypothetical protein
MIPATLKQEALELLIMTARAVLQREERPTQTSKRTKRPLANLCAIARNAHRQTALGGFLSTSILVSSRANEIRLAGALGMLA